VAGRGGALRGRRGRRDGHGSARSPAASPTYTGPAMKPQTLACRIGAGLSTSDSAWDAATEAAREARSGALGRAEVDLAFLFLSPAHLDEVEAAAEAVREELAPRHLLGCVAEGVLARVRELEEGPAVAVWAGALPGAEMECFHLAAVQTDGGIDVAGFPELDDPGLVALLVDPFTFPVGPFLTEAERDARADPAGRRPRRRRAAARRTGAHPQGGGARRGRRRRRRLGAARPHRRFAGLPADRTRGRDHPLRGQRRLRARRKIGARAPAQGDRRPLLRGAGARRARAARRARDRREPARLRHRRLPNARSPRR
jgi:hypothetical protein